MALLAAGSLMQIVQAKTPFAVSRDQRIRYRDAFVLYNFGHKFFREFLLFQGSPPASGLFSFLALQFPQH
ncbi:hypothetical protein [Janthinobacterium sp. MP5059B]|uniref:hypothetical protein n=1 Tax=Janthinobacterium sp. MP5059B TaxID=1766683 RepID=UPI0020C7CC00|nr:hypothetical protein [Janthinobacterium sp. MP5059B]